jgi:hypothetical protein
VKGLNLANQSTPSLGLLKASMSTIALRSVESKALITRGSYLLQLVFAMVWFISIGKTRYGTGSVE